MSSSRVHKAFSVYAITRIMNLEKVAGTNTKHDVLIYTLSTCGWCRKTKQLLKELDIAYAYIDVDLLTGDEVEKARKELKQYNPRGSYPTMVIDNGKYVIVGFKDDEIRGVLS